MGKRLPQCGHVWEMKRHVIQRLWRRFSFKERNRKIVVTNGNAMVELEFFA